MANQELIEKWENYTDYFEKYRERFLRAKESGDKDGANLNTDKLKQVIGAMMALCQVVFKNDDERDVVWGREVGYKAIDYVDEAIYLATSKTITGETDYERPEKGARKYIRKLEEYGQKHKGVYDYIEIYYQILLAMAADVFEPFCLYIERDRPLRERFYEPREKTLGNIAKSFQKLEDDELDRLFIHMPARVGKTQITTFYTAWHCAKDTESSNLYVTYKEGLGGAFLDGVEEIYTDPTYRFHDVFPKVKIIATDAKNNKLDLGTDARRRKKYKSLSGKGLESGLNGEYDANGVMILDDILEGVQDVLSKDVLERKRTIYQNNVVPRKKENCKVVYMGTIWATDDIYMKQREFFETDPTSQDLRVEVIKVPALDPDTDESNFDYEYGVGFSTAYYRSRRAEFEMNNDLAGWWCQCQQEPIDRQGTVFDPNGMKYYKTLPEGEPIKVIAHCDVALGGGDFLSFPVVYYFEDEAGDLEGYVEDVVFDNSEKHVTKPQVVAKIKKHHIRNVHFESNQGGEAYKDEVEQMIRDDREYTDICNIRSDWAPVTKRKEQRIWDCAQEIRQLYFKEPQARDDQYRKFMNNLFAFTMGKTSKRFHDDAADSLAGLVEFERNGSGVNRTRIIKSPF